MPVELWCAPGVFLAQVHEDIVVLDVKADRYDCLIDAADWMAVEDDGSIRVPDEALAGELVAAGIGAVDRPGLSRRGPQPARRDLTALPAPSRLALIGAGLSLANATLAFRGRTLGQLIETVGRPSALRAAAGDPRLAERVAAARGALPWIPFEGQCLQRAFQLRHVLARRGLAVDWVFGVRTWPFAAHCWLQSGDLVIADSVERVTRYTPIMAT